MSYILAAKYRLDQRTLAIWLERTTPADQAIGFPRPHVIGLSEVEEVIILGPRHRRSGEQKTPIRQPQAPPLSSLACHFIDSGEAGRGEIGKAGYDHGTVGSCCGAASIERSDHL